MKSLIAALCGCVFSVHYAYTADIPRIDLDGNEGVVAPAAAIDQYGMERVGKIDRACLELFPCQDKPSRGTVIVCPGGAYRFLAVRHEGRAVAKRLNACGYDAAVLLYHVNEGETTRAMALDEARKALTLVRSRGKEFGLNPKRVGLMGFSAGGHLAARLAHETADAAPPDFLVLIYPAYLEKGGRLLDEVVPPKVPIFLYVAADDRRWVPSSRALAAYCREHELPCTFTEAPAGGHGFGLKDPLPEPIRDWPKRLETFLDALR